MEWPAADALGLFLYLISLQTHPAWARIGAGLAVEGGTAVAVGLAARVKGLSEAAFRAAFGTEERCRAALEKLRWPRGFICPACGHGGHAWLAERKLHRCNRCNGS